ncbi:c-type cytochrome [Lautropia mirabilis]
MAVVLLGGCDSQPPTPPAGTGKPPGSGQVVRPDTRIATAQSATSETRSVSTGQAEEGGKPDEGTLVLPSDPPASDTPVSSSAAPDTGPPRTQAQAQASAPQAIDDATALRVLKSNHCASCHQPERKVVGPAFRDIGRRHAGQPDAGRQLAASILGGSSRNWGPVPMPPQPHVNDRDLKIIVDWILQQH